MGIAHLVNHGQLISYVEMGSSSPLSSQLPCGV